MAASSGRSSDTAGTSPASHSAAGRRPPGRRVSPHGPRLAGIHQFAGDHVADERLHPAEPLGGVEDAAGITLVWKRIQMLNDLALIRVMFFSGVVLPRAEMPAWAEAVGTPIFLTHSVEGLRTVMLDGARITVGGHGGLLWKLGTAAAWFLAGLLLFRIFERIAQRQGSLSHF